MYKEKQTLKIIIDVFIVVLKIVDLFYLKLNPFT